MRMIVPFRCIVVIGSILSGFAAAAAPPAASRAKEEAALLQTPTADLIATEYLAPAVRQAVTNGVATLVARITAEGNDHGLAFPPSQTIKLIEMVEVPAKRVPIEHPIYEHEYAFVEKIVPVLESGQPTGRFAREKVRVIVKSRQVGKKVIEHLRPDPGGSETMKVPKYGPGGPAAWTANLPGLNGMALYVLAKAGLGRHPATVKHAQALADHAKDSVGLPDATFDVAWMAAGFIALGTDSKYESLVRRLLDKLIDGQVRERGPLDGLWGPVCVNYGYYGKLFMLGQTVRQELDVHLPKKLETASPAQQPQVVAMGKEMRAVANAYERTHRDVFRSGTRMLHIRAPYAFEDEAVLPGLPLNAYQWVATDIESTVAATFALAEAKRAGLLPRETERLAIRGKKIHPPVKPEVAIKAAAKRLADAIDAGGGCSTLALLAANTGFEKTGFPAPAFTDAESPPPMFDLQTAATCVAADAALEFLSTMAPDIAKQLEKPRQRTRDRAAKIAARWYAESANPAADPWKGFYQSLTVSHAELKQSPILPVPRSEPAVDALPWGPSGSLYQLVPGFRGLFAEAGGAKDRFRDDLYRQIAYRLVALQDPNGQWSSKGYSLLSTASESLTIHRLAEAWHRCLTRDPPINIKVADPVPYESMLRPEFHGVHAGGTHAHGWISHQAARPDAAVFPTLASLLFLLEAIDSPVSLAGIPILPDEPPPEPTTEADAKKPPPRLSPLDAVRRVNRPSNPRDELFDAIIATRWPRTKASAEPAPAVLATAAETVEPPAKEEPAEDDGLGKFEDLLKPSAAAE
jgi:hypothetical protein